MSNRAGQAGAINWALIGQLALRDLRGGLRGFSVFVICVALGVTVIASVGVISDSLRSGFATEGRQMLGGDISFSRTHGRATSQERKDFAALGAVSEIATLRSMASAAHQNKLDGEAPNRVLIEIKAVDAAYPLAGDFEGTAQDDIHSAIAQGPNIVVAPILLERLGVEIGDALKLGSTNLTIVDTIAKEPDGLSARAAFGPRVMMSMKTLEATGLVAPGSLIRWRYRVLLSNDTPENWLQTSAETIKATFARRGFSIRDRRDPAPGITTAIDRFRQFLTLVGLTAMLVGGVGIANAVSTYLDNKRTTVAIFRAIGAKRSTVFLIYLTEILLIAAAGIALGLLFGLSLPWIGLKIAGASIPVPIEFTVEPQTLFGAVGYGFLVSLAFVLWPLGRIDDVRPAVLFRDTVAPERMWPRPAILGAICAVLSLLALLTIVGNDERVATLGYFAGITCLFAVFLALAWLIRFTSRRLPRLLSPEFSLALRNLSGPGALTQAIVLSLGTGLSLLVAVTLADASLVAELTAGVPKNAPSFYFLDVNRTAADRFTQSIKTAAPNGSLRQAPMLRGRIVSVGGRPADQIDAAPNAEWALRGDRGLTFAAEVPEGSRIVAGDWWPKNYAGKPLVSFEAEIAKGLGLKIGDEVTVNVLGRSVSATVSSLRTVDWGSLSINFVLIFSPNTLQAAPYNYLMTLAYDDPPTLADEAKVLRTIGLSFPEVTAIRVRDALNAVAKILDRVMLAIRTVGGLTLLVGAVVLAGAITTAQQRRTQQAVLLKTLGATRSRILRTGLYEFLILGLAVSLVAVLLGTLTAWALTTLVMDIAFYFDPAAVLEAVALALGLTLLLGAFSLRRILNARPVPYLRTT